MHLMCLLDMVVYVVHLISLSYIIVCVWYTRWSIVHQDVHEMPNVYIAHDNVFCVPRVSVVHDYVYEICQLYMTLCIVCLKYLS